ncbi:hypothetical protein MSAN_02077800 [Mycena sanguinolenta]|uniref:Uncharacterized protein n=1 Tax=Mycena sanguinolenta TaxID=230812 RepID=A0A8H6XGW5_9AGAR|nr:hypothetical protein MSAN_02077800 [Mycena sanguinolenta]
MRALNPTASTSDSSNSQPVQDASIALQQPKVGKNGLTKKPTKKELKAAKAVKRAQGASAEASRTTTTPLKSTSAGDIVAKTGVDGGEGFDDADSILDGLMPFDSNGDTNMPLDQNDIPIDPVLCGGPAAVAVPNVIPIDPVLCGAVPNVVPNLKPELAPLPLEQHISPLVQAFGAVGLTAAIPSYRGLESTMRDFVYRPNDTPAATPRFPPWPVQVPSPRAPPSPEAANLPAAATLGPGVSPARTPLSQALATTPVRTPFAPPAATPPAHTPPASTPPARTPASRPAPTPTARLPFAVPAATLLANMPPASTPPVRTPAARPAPTPTAHTPSAPPATTPPAQTPPASTPPTPPARTSPAPPAPTPPARTPPAPTPPAGAPAARPVPTPTVYTPSALPATTLPAQMSPASTPPTPPARTSPAPPAPTPPARTPPAPSPPARTPPAPPASSPPAHIPPGPSQTPCPLPVLSAEAFPQSRTPCNPPKAPKVSANTRGGGGSRGRGGGRARGGGMRGGLRGGRRAETARDVGYTWLQTYDDDGNAVALPLDTPLPGPSREEVQRIRGMEKERDEAEAAAREDAAWRKSLVHNPAGGADLVILPPPKTRKRDGEDTSLELPEGSKRVRRPAASREMPIPLSARPVPGAADARQAELDADLLRRLQDGKQGKETKKRKCKDDAERNSENVAPVAKKRK